MMKRLSFKLLLVLAIALFVSCSTETTTQPSGDHNIDSNFIWAKSAGGSGNDNGSTIAVDKKGNKYISGSFSNTAAFGNITLQGAGYATIFIAKMDSSNNWIWAKHAYGTNELYCNSITVDTQSNTYIVGSFSGVVNFGTTSLTADYVDGFIAKMDASGNWLWAKKTGGSDYDICLSIATDTQNNIYFTGNFFGNSSFGTISLTSTGSYDVFIAKMDTDGNWIWVKQLGGTSYEESPSIVIDIQDKIYITGGFNDTLSFGTTDLTSSGSSDIFVAKMDTDGNWLWAKNVIGIGEDWGISITTDVYSNAFITGIFESTVIFGATSLSSNGSSDIFCAKIDINGNWLWAKKAGGIGYDYINSIVSDVQGNTYVTGGFIGSVSFGTVSLIPKGGEDIFIAKMDVNGNWLWAKQVGGTSNDRGYSVASDSQNYVYVTGGFGSTATFGTTTLTSAGQSDIFIAKIK